MSSVIATLLARWLHDAFVLLQLREKQAKVRQRKATRAASGGRAVPAGGGRHACSPSMSGMAAPKEIGN